MNIQSKVYYKDLSQYNIQKLIICSLDQSIYQALVLVDDEERLVWEDDQRCFHSRSLMKMQESFEHLEIHESVLRQESAYDEMIGQCDKVHSNRMEVPLSTKPYSL